jgi:hypothetical protein
LEDTLQEGSNAGLTTRRNGVETEGHGAGGPVKISARVRDIITRNLAPPDGGWTNFSGTPNVEQLKEENRILQVIDSLTLCSLLEKILPLRCDIVMALETYLL